ncbi:MAG TPA: hypothetical protein PKL28_06880 [Rhodocyclaceae bacterium]|jgi:hypothetical protein|nr:hypothetical protein [Rhodocyclaceae bacterium]HMW76613.1 hypothetical protein [Rhodocyclaceae bacterium]HNE41627.1 hypothetical protein [Rhodocyclaceae bacterium]HNM22789.1 hypothetical protein [Rhodocyclaceae bacterium]HNM80761.1 hypothetical protein [Rhodocyclaceae bacterium]
MSGVALSRDRRLATLTLLLIVLITVTPRIPVLWDILDPIFFLLFDGEWKYVDIFYYSLVVLGLLDLARRLLDPRHWPWFAIASSVPVIGWALASCLWSRFPTFSLHEWFRWYLLPVAGLVFGYACFRVQVVTGRALRVAVILLPAYLLFGQYVLHHEFRLIGFDTVVTSTWMALAFPILFWWFAQSVDAGERYSWVPMLALCAWQVVPFALFPQRMYMLAIIAVTVMLVAGFGALRLTPRRSRDWFASCALLAILLVAAYYSISLTRPISYIAGDFGDTGGYYKVFARTERYEIFKYWLERGQEHFWAGVGLGWQLPAIEYNRRFLEYSTQNESLYSHGHNYLINVWLQTGIVGVGALAFWGAGLVRHAGRGFADATPAVKRMFMCFIALFAVLLLRNLSDDGMREGNPLFFWLLLGGCLGYIDHKRY